MLSKMSAKSLFTEWTSAPDLTSRNDDLHHLRAAEGWLELRNCSEATGELDKLGPEVRNLSDVLAFRWHVHARAKDMVACLEVARQATKAFPNDHRGWIALAQTFYYQGQIEQAYRIARPKVRSFPHSWELFYDLTCYACLLGDRKAARKYFHRAITNGDADAIKERALSDPDLQTLWQHKAAQQATFP
jgi:hypothetical protein